MEISEARRLKELETENGYIEPGAPWENAYVESSHAQVRLELLDRELFRMLGVHPETMKVLVVKSSNHFRADFTPIASHILVAKAAGPMAADPADLPWTKLAKTTRTKP